MLGVKRDILKVKYGTFRSFLVFRITENALHDLQLSMSRFGEDVLEKMRDWVVDNVPVASSPSVLDIGTGNGNVLFQLIDAGYRPERLWGVDYSEDAIHLAKNVAASRQVDSVTFKVMDFLNESSRSLTDIIGDDGWDLILDKGTLDAIALAAPSVDDSLPSDKYPERVMAILKPGGFFLITCDYNPTVLIKGVLLIKTRLTQRAILRNLSYGESLRMLGYIISTCVSYYVIEPLMNTTDYCSSHIKHPTITFGGHSGSTYATVAFQK